MAGPVELIETRPHKAMVILRSLPNRPGIAAELFTQLGKGGFNVEMISQCGVSGALADISFAVGEEEVERAIEHLKDSSSLKIRDYSVVRNMGVLTAYGKALAYEPGIAGRIFFLLAGKGAVCV